MKCKFTNSFTRHLNILFVFIVFVLISCERNNLPLEKYEYIGVDTGRIITFNTINNEMDNGHTILSFEFCDSHSYVICLYGEITLAIPKGNLKVGSNWSVAGSDFTVSDIIKEDGVNSYVITVKPSAGENINIFYAKDSGIWGIKHNDWEMYKVKNRCGLGCTRSIKE